jgi:sulfite reductase (ferredoxin)
MSGKVEEIKENSVYLRGTLAEDAQAAEVTHFDDAGKQLLKFHGIYQQDNRDGRQEARRAKREKSYIFMVRSKIPGGELTADQYLVHEDLASRYGNGTLRITTRQGLQFHGVLKGNIKRILKEVNEALVTTLGACGDVVRNTMCCPVPVNNSIRQAIQEVTHQIATHLAPQTRAYHEVWLDGEKVYNGEEAGPVVEPIYGKTYLPRKFKIGVAYPGDNCVDVYTQDVGLIAVAAGENLLGFNVLAGGSMGMTHNKPDTFPRLGDPLAFVLPEQVIQVVEQIVCIQRDYGDRSNRKHARMKYLIHEWGIDRFRAELEQRLGYALQDVVPMPAFDLELHLGWHQQDDDHWYLGVSVENGRIHDVEGLQLRSGLRRIIETYRPGIRFTPNHDILLTDLHAEDKVGVDVLLREYGIQQADTLSNIQLYSMACPAMPTCGLALAEAERALPEVIDHLEQEIARLGLQDERLSVRMTGCPNGCARPYTSDLAFVGRSLDRYMIYVGGGREGARLNQPYQDVVLTEDLVKTVLPLFVFFKQARQPQEGFGDFCNRVGLDALHTFADNYQKNGTNGHNGFHKQNGHSTPLEEPIYEQIKE